MLIFRFYFCLTEVQAVLLYIYCTLNTTIIIVKLFWYYYELQLQCTFLWPFRICTKIIWENIVVTFNFYVLIVGYYVCMVLENYLSTNFKANLIEGQKSLNMLLNGIM